ncbi:MAG TPA: PKD domain containing protein, partial [Acidimicrobiia bacterium]|nr:PKD domain containing protein [Acidimicrobiia bacterium]
MRGRTRVLFGVVVAALLPLVPAHALNSAHGGIVATDPVAWTPEILDGEVMALVPMGGEIVAGGSFTQVRDAGRATVYARPGLVAFDARTGAVDPNFAPVFDKEVQALAADPGGQAVFVGGRFRHLNGAPAAGLAKVDLATGLASPGFSVTVSGSPSPWVFSLAVRGPRLYLGGTFDAVDGTARSLLAAVDPTTGALDTGLDIPFSGPRKGAPRVDKLDVTPDGSRLVAIGNFTKVAGQDRVQLAVLDVGTRQARLANWETDRFKDPCAAGFDTCMRDVDIAPDGSYFVVVTTGAYRKGSLWDAVSRFEMAQSGLALQPTWVDLDGGDSFTGVAVAGAAIYVAGHNRWMNNPRPNGTNVNAMPGPGAVPRTGIAALDPSNGLPFSWNPTKSRGMGARALLATADGLWVGSDTESLGGRYHARLAMCPLAGGASVPTATAGTLPGALALLGLDGRLVRRPFDGSTAGPPTEVAT